MGIPHSAVKLERDPSPRPSPLVKGRGRIFPSLKRHSKVWMWHGSWKASFNSRGQKPVNRPSSFVRLLVIVPFRVFSITRDEDERKAPGKMQTKNRKFHMT
jgi:hypothetical protein